MIISCFGEYLYNYKRYLKDRDKASIRVIEFYRLNDFDGRVFDGDIRIYMRELLKGVYFI